ncbi:hypothetical protein LINPERHAP2_LOCUS22492 [Linum perenne]
MFLTGPSFWYFPRLPMLIPWLGPHFVFWMVMVSRLSIMETQSSPVPMVLSVMVMCCDLLRWMPSVFTLVAGAITFTCEKVMLLQSRVAMWKNLLSLLVMPSTQPFMMF